MNRFLTAILLLASLTAKASAERPNVIFLMDDQRRWDALGVVNEQVRTPTLDRLARSGVRFTQAVCQAPMCVPSRNSMMLGLYPNEFGVLRNGPGIPDQRLPTPTLPELFRRAGYQTAGFGKTHWGTRIKPSTRGFEVRCAAECFEEGAVMMRDDAPEAKRRYDAESRTMGGGEENNRGYLGFASPLPEKEHRDGWVTEKCLDFIRNEVDPDRPLFLYLSFLKPHAGHNVPAGYESRYDVDAIDYARQPGWLQEISPHAAGNNRNAVYEGFWATATERQWREMTMRYYANCTWIDAMFGRALDALKKKGLLDNALIVYCSDHGEMLGERHYRFNKYCLYDASVRVPLIVGGSALPQELRATTDARPAELIDLHPTLLRVAGIELPVRARGLDLLGEQRRKASFAALHQGRPAFMLRTAAHKLILVMREKKDADQYAAADVVDGEFYDLKDDPREWNDLYRTDRSADVRRQMTADLLQLLKTMKPLVKP